MNGDVSCSHGEELWFRVTAACCSTTQLWLLSLFCTSVIMVVSRNMTGKNMARPPLKRFVSSAAWVDTEEPSVMMKG